MSLYFVKEITMKAIYKIKYPHLFLPMTVGRRGQLTYKNRILVPPMGPTGDGVDSHNRINPDGVKFYTQFACGGFAGITASVGILLNSGHRGFQTLDDNVDGFVYMHNMQRGVHMYGANTLCELYHPGCCTLPESGYEIISASSFVYNGHHVREMNEFDMEAVTSLFVKNAILAMRAGFDGICLHYGHGWLMNNFLSPLSNHRTDSYGGSVENRVRFPMQVIKAIRDAIGYDMIIELRLNGSDKTPGGITPEDAAEQALIMQDEVDMIHVSCGTRLDAHARPQMHPTCFVPEAHNADAAWTLKKAGVKVPVGVVGAIGSAATAEKLIADGKCDYVLIGRQSVADPYWFNKVREGREEDIRPCIRCDYCLDGGRRGSHTTEVNISDTATFDGHCSVNPLYRQGQYKEYMLRDTTPKKVAVVGGGIAGMQAALKASERGHDVTLFEKNAVLGGQTSFYPEHLWFKGHVRDLREYFITQLKKSNVTVLLNTAATPAMIEDADFDACIVAVGAKQNVPPIPGVEKAVMAWDFFGHEAEMGQNIVVVGGGSVGCEIAIQLAGKGRHVTVLEMTAWLAANSQISERMSLEEHLNLNHVETLLETTCTHIADDGVTVRSKDGTERFIAADTVIVSAGSRPLADERNLFTDTAFDVINVGDCEKVGTIRTAIESGWDAAASL
jgi:2,4-dienoyl-CoA reductase-like NADH-dependent reductase (Old Yellow Enzyme family)/thioredoxin reductase